MVWITFANRRDDSRPPRVEASACLLDKWKRGLTFRIIIHIDYIEDHTSVPLDDFITTANTILYEPITTTLPWSLGGVDRMPESKGSMSHLP